ncbi:MAG: hypothetical protein ACRCS9_09095 [Hyphomicrobium sp.]
MSLRNRRSGALIAATAAAVLGATSLASAQGYTTRIETRPFYGATVTLEEGVRVFRPLPPERQVIINPGGQTPLSLGFHETRVYERRSIRNYNYGDGGSSATRTNGGYFGGTYGYGRGYHGGGHHQGGHVGGGSAR